MTPSSLPRSPYQALQQIWFHPKCVFRALKSAKGWSWWPFLLLTLGTAGVQWLYLLRVDFDWYRHTVLAPSLGALAPADRESLLAMFSANQWAAVTLITSLLGMVVINALVALYLSRMTRLDEENLEGFSDWYGLCWWLQLPMLVSVLVSTLMILAASGEIEPSLLSPLALNRLLNLPMEATGYALAESISLLLAWSLLLAYWAIRTWTKLNRTTTVVIVLLPWLALLLIQTLLA
ncbi:YIP1 family protein [Ferrimonas gelatinilytica]|uniref:Yip1 domain-containing protein n=1 Tax=Ferrimonas gelatinilytica TaxID=1255257 RepID=A0ABP9S1R2_9GAMM